MSLVPYLTVERRGIAEARAASRTDFRIEAGDVYALHRHRIRRAADQSCKFNDFFVPAVQLAKRCFAIELKRQKRLLAGPVALCAKRIDRRFDCLLHGRVEAGGLRTVRSEERRVGKGGCSRGRYRWTAEAEKKKK